jgi:hypothetical protein
MTTSTRYFPLLLLLLVCPICFFTQEQLTTQYPVRKIEDLKYLPSGKFLQGAALGYDAMLADLLWIKGIAYLGEHAKTDQDYTWLYHILDITTTLDPMFEEPYEMGAVVLASDLHEVDKSISLARKGMEHVPEHHKRYWYLPFYIAFDYMYYKDDYLTAARYLEQAARFPQRPDYLPLLVSRLYANTEDPSIALPFLREMEQNASSPELKKKLQQRIKEVMVEQDIRFLEQAVDRYVARYGSHPETVQDLQQAGIIRQVPQEPFGGWYSIDQKDHTVRSSTTAERLKVHIKKNRPKIEQIEIK